MNNANIRGELEFPLEYLLKVIFSDAAAEKAHIQRLESLLDALGIPRGAVSLKQSGKGLYVSLSVPVTLSDRTQFEQLYKELDTLPCVKCAI